MAGVRLPSCGRESTQLRHRQPDPSGPFRARKPVQPHLAKLLRIFHMVPTSSVDLPRVERAYWSLRDELLSLREPAGHWSGELSTSALSTATAVMALELVRRDREGRGEDASRLDDLIAGGERWLVNHQNADGGWGDTVLSYSNISTTMLARASLERRRGGEGGTVLARAADYIDRVGGIPALKNRYGKDKTFSVPILTHCALAGLVDWRAIPALPFELACIPAKWYAAARLPVVSYALPALIAIGQVRHHFAPTRNPIARLIRNWTRERSLGVLERIQPSHGGFLEATPLTSFVTMSLAGMGLSDHPVAVKGVEFIVSSVLPDGSWPIDTNLATWVTTLSVNALGDDLPEESREPIRRWLLEQQYREVHPFTNAAPGGWAWTDLPGGVPDGDDTAGAVLALANWAGERGREGEGGTSEAAIAGVRWLVGIQNRDGGFPTFCRGWGTLPFDRSSPDITAHAFRALTTTLRGFLPDDDQSAAGASSAQGSIPEVMPIRLRSDLSKAIIGAIQFLYNSQRPDGSWLPLWFGNQDAPDDINPTYGTARVLAAFRDAGLADDPACRRGVTWLLANQNEDGGWGGVRGAPSSVEETALAVEILVSLADDEPGTWRGVQWLVDRVEAGTIAEATPIGFYFAKLWYFERLYPVVFGVGALGAARQALMKRASSGHDGVSHC